MYLALSGWLSIVLVVALAAWQEDSEQSDDGEARIQSGPYAEVHPLDDDEPGHHSYTSHSLRYFFTVSAACGSLCMCMFWFAPERLRVFYIPRVDARR